MRAWDGGGDSGGGWLGGHGEGSDVMHRGGGSGMGGGGAREGGGGGGGGAIGRCASGWAGRCRSLEGPRVTGRRHAESGVDQLESVHLRREGLTFLYFLVVEGCLETGVMVQWRWTHEYHRLTCLHTGRKQKEEESRFS